MILKNNKFTLVEMVVVIAVLLILVSLLQTSLTNVLTKAKSMDCSNNLKNLGTGVAMYTQDEGYFPVAVPAMGSNEWAWPAQVRMYLHGSDSTANFNCPSAPKEAHWVAKYDSANKVPARMGYYQDEMRLPQAVNKKIMSYGYNAQGPWGQRGLGVVFNHPDPRFGFVKPHEVIRPNNMIALADSNWDIPGLGEANIYGRGSKDWSSLVAMYSEDQWPLDLHDFKANINFVDGHVESLWRFEFVAQLNTEKIDKDNAQKKWNRTGLP